MNPIPTHVLVALRELTMRFVYGNRDWLRLEAAEGTPPDSAFEGKERTELLLGPDSLGPGLALWATNVREEHGPGRNVVYVIKSQPDGSLGFRALL